MTQFKTFTDAERAGLKLHGLNTDGPSQLSDAFVLGMRYAIKHHTPTTAEQAIAAWNRNAGVMVEDKTK